VQGENWLEIFTSNGVIVAAYRLAAEDPLIHIDLGCLPQGLYIACLRNEQYSISRRFIISRN
jgi:hypothetical protein